MRKPDGFRGMKGQRLDSFDQIKGRYPFLASVKLDGIRAFTFEREQLDLLEDKKTDLLTLSMEQIPNRHIQKTISDLNITGLDGEIITYTDGVMDKYTDDGDKRGVMSKVMTGEGKPEFKYHVFDLYRNGATFYDRQQLLIRLISSPSSEQSNIVYHQQYLIENEGQLVEFESQALIEGFEGVMLRSGSGLYKFGRSTIRQGDLIKIKRFKDAEATIIGFEEGEHNLNEPIVGKTGLIERSDHKAGKVPSGSLGAFICVGHNNIEFRLGIGIDDALKQKVWNNRDEYKFKIVKYKYQPYGVKTAPRSPVFLGFRDKKDIEL